MILTGSEIRREWQSGRIVIQPFVSEQINPNSYNFRLGRTLSVYRDKVLDPRTPSTSDTFEIPEEGFVLEPGELYLAHTVEVLGSDFYAPTFAARSSVARLGIFINLSASLGDIGFKGQWTLQLYALNRVRVYPGMNIGQIMWWLPQGRIELYGGKYQGSRGPRSSDIHLDFEKQLARHRFPALDGAAVDDEVGPKFAALARASGTHLVPAAFALPVAEFHDAMSPEQAADLADAFSDLRATVGAFYQESIARISGIGRTVRMPQDLRDLLLLRMADVFGDHQDKSFAVRSSGVTEDGAVSSLAGAYESLLHVRGADELVAAVEQCWASFYAGPGVAARLRAGDQEWAPRLAVFVQEMVEADIAGVAFSGSAADGSVRVDVEYVSGPADELVAGVAVPDRAVFALEPDAGGVCTTDGADERLHSVVAMVRSLRESHGHDVDVEWAIDERGTHLLQVRPLTAALGAQDRSETPLMSTHSLYYDQLPPGTHLDAVAGIYGGYVAKRRTAYEIAAKRQVAVAGGWVVRFNGRGIHDEEHRAVLARALASPHSDECVLDLGDQMRQIIVAKPDVPAKLLEMTGVTAAGTEVRAAIVRDFVRGTLGVISRLSDGSTVVECATEGLMALNRGTAGAVTVVLDKEGDGALAEAFRPLRPHLRTITDFTAELSAVLGPITLEWVLAGDSLYFVDYTALGDDEMTVTSQGVVLMSAGHAQGPLHTLTNDALLARLSIGPAVSVSKSHDVSGYGELAALIDEITALPEPPILRCSRPYAVLSVLIGHVAGFIFDEGSTLGHLAILLREAGVPAVVAAGFDATGTAVIGSGTVTVRNGHRHGDS